MTPAALPFLSVRAKARDFPATLLTTLIARAKADGDRRAATWLRARQLGLRVVTGGVA